MQKHPEITRRRIQKFLNDSNLRGKLFADRKPVNLSVYSAPDRIPFAHAVKASYRPAKVGEIFGPAWSTHWFKVDTEIPSDWKGREVHFLWDSSSEACVWIDGVPVQGLTGTSKFGDATPTRPRYMLTKSAKGGEKLSFYVEIACNGLFGVRDGLGDERKLRQAEIAVFDREAWDLYWDFVIVADMAQHLPADTPRAGQALYAANKMVNVCDLHDRSTWPAARKLAADFFKARNGDGQHNLSAIGHAHIDTAWLWPLAETKRKCYRTFSTALRYMADYPEYKFACSQAQQYEWMKESQPVLYEKIKKAVAAGQFVPCGGTWVEPDCNIPSGESLVRQFLVGQRFFRKEFGITCREFWNPDVFGYNGQLPQIMRGAGIEYFLTQKLSWNQFNKPQSHTFLWEGIDGTRVLTHFPPADTYNAVATVQEVLFNVKNFKDHDRANESYYLFGYGDGGGGPTEEMLESLRRMKDVDGLPRVEIRSPQEFFARCATDVKDPLIWVGELYFELHRGTYTSQARNKLGNRRCENLLHDVEFLAALGRNYPAAELESLWKVVLLNQFHDIIPGSSIKEVYVDSGLQYHETISALLRLRDQAVNNVLPQATGGHPGKVAAINTLGAARREVVELPVEIAGAQKSAHSKSLGIVSAPSMGYSVSEPSTSTDQPASIRESGETIVLENHLVRATFLRSGELTGLFDKTAGREAILPDAKGNRMILFDDEPINWDAWDVDVFHLEKPFPIKGSKFVKITEKGPLRVAFEVEHKLSGASTLRQTISLSALSARVDFACECDWHEHHKFLKVEFPFNIRADHATYEIQFGHLQRPTHFNTSWDMARFEVCGYRWADLSEPDFGVALLNDCKYGYATHRNVMRLSLLRSPKSPDPEADMGKHTFRYALLPHAGSFQEAGVIEEAQRFNSPMLLHKTGAELCERSYFSVNRPNVVIDTVKKAEDSDAIIVRLYEAHGCRGTFRLSSTLPVKLASRCNLLEEEDQPVSWSGNGADLDIAPFQIVTLKLSA